MPTSEEIKGLFAEFPMADVHWRAQQVTKDGTKALALAYIDARDVMDRLDNICGSDGWQNRYSHADNKVVCEIGIKVDGEWIWKANGAGDTQVEAEKGSLSDAFKRAAVLWGIGRYLYAIPAPWVPCKCSEYKGKMQWKSWIGDPWDFVKGNGTEKPKAQTRDVFASLIDDMRAQKTVNDLARWKDKTSVKAAYANLAPDWKQSFAEELAAQKQALENAKVVTA